MRRSRAPSIAPGTFFVAQSWADCITNMAGFDLRQAQAHEVDQLVAAYGMQPWQERPCGIPGMPLIVQAYEYLLYQIFSLMRTEAHANETRRKRSTQGSRNFLEHALVYDGFAAPFGAHGL